MQLGHDIVDRARTIIAGIEHAGLCRSVDQVEMTEYMLACTARFIYGAALDMHEQEIKERNQWTDLRQELILIAMRRMGKSVAAALYSAAIFMAVIVIKIVIFSTGEQAASAQMGLLGGIISILTKYAGVESFTRKSERHVVLGEREVHAMTGSEDR